MADAEDKPQKPLVPGTPGTATLIPDGGITQQKPESVPDNSEYTIPDQHKAGREKTQP